MLRATAVLALLLGAAACSRDEPATDPAATATAPADGQPIEPPAQAVSAQVAAMSADDLREAASDALREQRLYAPGGNNAMEYYLALRDKQPNDPAVASALTDLMPYTLIATEQSIARDDFAEAQRLYALMEKTDADAPALPRLEQSIADAQAEAARLAAVEEARSEEDAERATELAEQREQEQQQAQQEAASQLAREQAEQREERRLADERAAEQRAAQQRPAQPASTPAEDEPASSGVTNTQLIVVSSAQPEYPREALRRRQSGSVEVEFVVSTDGSVTSARVAASTPPRVFDNAALEAVRQWTFQPLAAPQTVRQTLSFNPGG